MNRIRVPTKTQSNHTRLAQLFYNQRLAGFCLKALKAFSSPITPTILLAGGAPLRLLFHFKKRHLREMVYITKRFDRQPDGSKLHQEDLLQCAGLPSESKYHFSYEEAGKLIDKVTHGKQAAVLDFVRRVILAYVTGNDELHMKNFSVQRLADNTSHYYDKLTPNYDCLFCDAFNFCDVFNKEDKGMGLLALELLHDSNEGREHFTDMYNHYGYYTGYDFLELGWRLGLQKKPIRSFIAKLKDNQKKITDLIHHSYMPDAMKDRAAKLVEFRIKSMQTVDSNI